MNNQTFPEYFIVAETNKAGLAIRFLQPADLAGFWNADADFAYQFADYVNAQSVACDWQDFLRLKGIGHGCTVLHVKNGGTADIGLDHFDPFGLPLF